MFNAVYPIPGNETKLPFYLSGIGKTSPEFHIKRDNGLCSHQFLFTVKGRGTLVVNDRRYALEKNSLLYLPPELPHEYYPESGEWSTCWMVFRGDKLSDCMKNMGFECEMIAEGADISAFKRIYNKIYGLAADNLHNSKKCSLLIYEAVLLAGDIFDGRSSPDNTGNLIVDKAMQYINEHCCSDISLNELAALSGISPQHFCRLFKARLNIRPMEYIARVKLSKAKSMLLNSDMPVSEIARSIGYSSHTYFGIIFKRYEGVSPTEFRKNCGSLI